MGAESVAVDEVLPTTADEADDAGELIEAIELPPKMETPLD